MSASPVERAMYHLWGGFKRVLKVPTLSSIGIRIYNVGQLCGVDRPACVCPCDEGLSGTLKVGPFTYGEACAGVSRSDGG